MKSTQTMEELYRIFLSRTEGMLQYAGSQCVVAFHHIYPNSIDLCLWDVWMRSNVRMLTLTTGEFVALIRDEYPGLKSHFPRWQFDTNSLTQS